MNMICEIVSRWINEWMKHVNQWVDENLNQRSNESMISMNPEINEPMMQGTKRTNEAMNELMNQWLNESVIKTLSWWTSDWMIFFLRRWVDESESIHEWPDGRMNYGWMSELLLCCASFSLSDLFAEAPLLLATSSLSSLFSATSSLTLLWAFPGSSSIDSATQFFSSRTMRLATSSCNPACQESQHQCFAARSHANAFGHKRLQIHIPWSIAPKRPTSA